MLKNRFDEAQECCMRAMELDPDSEANINFGNLLRQLG